MRIFLADLGHNQVTISSDVYPLGVANLTTYVQAYSRVKEPLEIRIFREPLDLKAALDDDPPDVLGLSSYAWNHELSLHFARYAKARHPKILTLMGGPNFPLTSGEQETFLRSMPEIDIAVRGPTYEGERAFLNIIRRFSEVGQTLEGLQEEPVPDNMWINRRTGEFVQGGEVERIRDLDEIPSPYLAGLMDPFFATGYFPMMQISRGCPFSCAFCNSAVESNNKIFRHSVENVRADLLYTAERIRPEIPLCFADDNFGMYPWDEEVADYFGYLQDHFNWPQYIRTTTGKNNHERIIRVMRKARGILPMTSAVQSLNPEVLKNIKRSNIKLETYAKIQEEVKAQGMQAYGELILCLPGETKASFMKAVHDLLETGVKRVSAHQLMLLHGAPLSNPESRQRWGFKTRFRVVARNLGNYTGEPIVEVEEVVVETPTFSFQDYLEARVFHLLLTIFYYEGNFEEAFEFARQEGIEPFDLIVRLQSTLDQAPAGFKKLIDDFLQESQEELFNTKEECIAWSRRHFDALVDGSIGGNLLSKYSMIGRFCVTPETLDFLEAGIEAALGESLTETQLVLLRTVMEYLRTVILHVPFTATLAATPHWTTFYDMESWRHDGYAKRLETYRYQEPQTFATIVEPKRKALIESRITTFGEHPSGLGKFTRTMFAQDLRRTLIGAMLGAEAAHGV
jgi:radical SAM superfamily enzyme YgiQ (UPF0313 family)